tara:strand:+ start:170 stop:484 length:315 start_codon:yes stop_codon:yes gene_type:complete
MALLGPAGRRSWFTQAQALTWDPARRNIKLTLITGDAAFDRKARRACIAPCCPTSGKHDHKSEATPGAHSCNATPGHKFTQNQVGDSRRKLPRKIVQEQSSETL